MVKVRIDLVRDDGLAAAPEEPAPVRAADEVEAPEALKKRGDAAFRRGEAAAAARLWTRAAAAGRDDRRLAVACLANTARAQFDLGRAEASLRAALDRYRTLGDKQVREQPPPPYITLHASVICV